MRLIFVFQLIRTVVFAATPLKEINFLNQLYSTLGGDSWFWRPTRIAGLVWDFTSPNVNPCSTNLTTWQGIRCDLSPRQCDTRVCHIITVNLETYGLKGTLPDNWSELPSLINIDLGSNNLKGTFPRSLIPPILLQTFYIEINSLTGPLPGDIIAQMTSLINLDLSNNGFTGPFPAEFGLLTRLEHFEFRRLDLTGGIPSSIGDLRSLTLLDLTANLLTGTIPLEIAKLTSLVYLDMDINLLSGTIPLELGSLHHLTLLDLSYNFLTGQFPSTFGSLTSLSKLCLHFNYLTGPIPSLIGSLSRMVDIYLTANQFTGPIPSEVQSFAQLTNLDLLQNFLTGEIPSSIWNLTKLEVLNIGTNFLTGTLPPEIGGMSRVSWLNLLVNSLTGIIPSEINQLMFLQYLYLGHNLFSGPLVCDPSKFFLLVMMDYQNNYLSGSLCPTFSSNMKDIKLNSNLLTGTLPSGLGLLKNLDYLRLDQNHFVGRIPREISNMSSLYSLTLSRNHLTHRLPSELGDLTNLRQLYLQSNFLNGGLEDVLYNSSALNWVHVDLSENIMSGSMPSTLFQISSLITVILTSNCFHGTLPSNICHGSKLQVLSLDGLGASDDCPRADLLSIRRDRLLDGSIPPCLWSLENLTTISLAGNGLTGSIGRLPTGSKLQNLTLSHNKLSGAIPRSVQQHWFQRLDLSFNRFTGEVGDLLLSHNSNANDTTRKSILILEVNRLSGVLNSLQTSHSTEQWELGQGQQYRVNILSGNLFSCDHLPTLDENYREYLCGSEDLDRSMIVFGAIVTILALIAVTAFVSLRTNSSLMACKSPRALFASLAQLLKASSLSAVANGYNLQLKRISAVIVLLTLCGLLLLMPLYLLRSMNTGGGGGGGGGSIKDQGDEEEDSADESEYFQYSTHTHLYRWSWTLAYSTGQTPAAFLISTWTISILLFVITLQAIDSPFPRASSSSSSPSEREPSRSPVSASAAPPASVATATTTPIIAPAPSPSVLAAGTADVAKAADQPGTLSLRVIILLCLDLLIVGGANAAYIYSTTQDFSSRNQLTFKITLAIFNFLWSEGFTRSSHVVLNISYAIIKTIVIPCLATALTSTSCFQNLLVPPDKITTFYEYISCSTYALLTTTQGSTVICTFNQHISASVSPFIPPFSYNFICFSTILTAYLPVFLLTYCLKILLPIASSSLLIATVNYHNLPKPIRVRVRGILWPNHWSSFSSIASTRRRRSTSWMSDLLPRRSSTNTPPQTNNLSTVVMSSLHSSSSAPAPPAPAPPATPTLSEQEQEQELHVSVEEKCVPTAALLFKPAKIFGSVTQDFCVLLTFGLCSPILAMAVAVHSSLATTHTTLLISRFIHLRSHHRRDTHHDHDTDTTATLDTHGDAAIDALELSLSHLSRGSYLRMVWPILWSSGLFVAFLCWEISGDTVGWEHSLWAPLTVVAMALAIHLLAISPQFSSTSFAASVSSQLISLLDQLLGSDSTPPPLSSSLPLPPPLLSEENYVSSCKSIEMPSLDLSSSHSSNSSSGLSGDLSV